MTNLTRWKLATALFAAVAAVTTLTAWSSGDRPTGRARPVVSAASGRSLPAALRRPIRISAAAIGMSERDLIDRILASRSTNEIQMLAGKLGTVGSDEAVESLVGLVDDHRQGVPEAIIAAFGGIGTDRAVDLLIELSDDDRPRIRGAAIGALGASQAARAEAVLTKIGKDRSDPSQSTAIYALGTLGSDTAAVTLTELATGGDWNTGSYAVWALGSMSTEASRAALRTLVTAEADARIRAAALNAIDLVDDATAKLLKGLVEEGDPNLAGAALGAIGRAGDATALPLLATLAAEGPQQARWAAVTAIGQIGGDEAIKVLGNLLRSGDQNTAQAAVSALVNIGGKAARDVVIEVALSDRGTITGALYQLGQLRGPDVEKAMMTIAKTGSSRDKIQILPQLVRSGSEEALAMAVQLAQSGPRNDRWSAMRMLADAGTDKAVTALVEIAEKAHGESRGQALDMLAQVRPGDPAVGQLLVDAVFSGRQNEAQQAVWTLARLGTEDSRQALITALTGDDEQLASTVAGAIGQAGMTKPIREALVAAAKSGKTSVKTQAIGQLINYGTEEGMQLAEATLLGDDAEAARQTAYSLANVGSGQSRALLMRALGSKDSQVRSAAVGALASGGDDKSTDTVIGLVKDQDAQVRSAAVSALGSMGSSKAVDALIDVATTGSNDDKMAAANALASAGDARAEGALARLIGDKDQSVAQTAIYAAYNGGEEIDRALAQLVTNTGADQSLRTAAANQLRNRGGDVDAATQAQIDKLLGSDAGYGGYAYGRYYDRGGY